MRAGRALVVGGGIGGLAAAIALARCGWSVEVHEQGDALREIGAGLTVWPNGVKALRRLGVEDAVVERASRFERFEVRRWDGRPIGASGAADYAERFGAPILCVPRPDLLAALAARVGPARVHVRSRLVALEERGAEVVGRFADGREAAADLLVGADGLRSQARAALLADGPARYVGYTCYAALARLEHPAFDRSVSIETWGAGTRFGLLPCGAGQAFWWAIRNAREGGADGRDGRKADVRRLVAGWREPVPAAVEAAAQEAILRIDVYDRDPVRSWGAGRAVLLGDAAHPSTPNLGQGATLALEDALVLADALRAAPDLAAGLASYVERRRERTSQVVLRARRIGRMGQLEAAPAVWLRDRFAGGALFQRRILGWIESLCAYEPPALP
ncbi:MAG: FAD-dependent monooxygenase [Planctomycetes bacterium]|nr:FAD-dependent monooxygenase [Planctomycetota bacterium]